MKKVKSIRKITKLKIKLNCERMSEHSVQKLSSTIQGSEREKIYPSAHRAFKKGFTLNLKGEF